MPIEYELTDKAIDLMDSCPCPITETITSATDTSTYTVCW